VFRPTQMRPELRLTIPAESHGFLTRSTPNGLAPHSSRLNAIGDAPGCAPTKAPTPLGPRSEIYPPHLIESNQVTAKPSATGLRPASMGTAKGRYLLGFSRRHDVRTGSSPAAESHRRTIKALRNHLQGYRLKSRHGFQGFDSLRT